MNLVVSVIVALSILGILLYILGWIPSFGGDAKDTLRSELRSVQASGYKVGIPQKITFKEGSVFLRGELTTDVPIKPEDIVFVCDDTSICNGDPFKIENDNLKISGKLQIYSVVCGNSAKPTEPKYCISFARDGAKATSDCISKCELK